MQFWTEDDSKLYRNRVNPHVEVRGLISSVPRVLHKKNTFLVLLVIFIYVPSCLTYNVEKSANIYKRDCKIFF